MVPDRPRVLKGAFVEYGKSNARLAVPFQFNPETISRQRSNRFSVPGEARKPSKEEREKGERTSMQLRGYHFRFKKLTELRDKQEVEVGSETISFDIRLDAAEKLPLVIEDDRERRDEQQKEEYLGIAPELATLELMMYPRTAGSGKSAIPELLSAEEESGYTFTGKEKPPMILFVWGSKKVVPVNITSMNIKEEEFGPNLHPIRATVSVSLTVIEGPNDYYIDSMRHKEGISNKYLSSIPKVETFIPKTKKA